MNRFATRIRWCLALAGAVGLRAHAQEPTRPTSSASETNPAIPAAGHSIHGEAFDDGPRARAYLLPGQGHGGFPITTSSPEAQAFFNQGVAQLHTFYYLEAERSFRQAALHDPDAPMTYWGMAMANVNNAKRARGFLKEAQKRAETVKPSRHEQLYLDGLAAFYREKGDDKAKRQDWLKALETIVQDFPNDLDARAWLAMVTWQNSQKGDGIGSRQAVDELIESVLRIDPKHPGALHYRIHMWDGVKQERAVKAAAEYGPAAAGIAHAWHMPGHTYTGLKRYADAAYQQEASARVDHAAMARDRTMPFAIHNYAHNNQWLCTSLSHIGRARDAITVARNLVEQPRDPKKNGKNDGGSSQRSGRARWSEVLVRYELWDDLIAAVKAGDLDWSDIPLERKERAYTLGLAYAHKGDRAHLVEQIEVLKGLLAQEPNKDDTQKNDAKADEAPKKDDTKPQEDTSAGTAVAKAVKGVAGAVRRAASAPGVRAALTELEGYLLLFDGKTEEALKTFDKATSMRPELKARAQLRAGEVEKALATAKSAVDRNPNQVPPLVCHIEILNAAGKTQEAREAYETLRPLIGAADTDVPMMRRLAAILAKWKDTDGWAPSPLEEPTDDATAGRVPLESLGPLCWSPTLAEPLALPDTRETTWSLAEHRGRTIVLLFYLGGQCAHCMQQLQEFGKAYQDFQAMGVDVVGVSTDDLETTKLLKNNEEDITFPMPLLSDPRLDVFKAYRCFDDFENQPLHGTFLIDSRGFVRFQNISYEPFLDVEFIKGEAARVMRLVKP
jgi:peroxiredoxin